MRSWRVVFYAPGATTLRYRQVVNLNSPAAPSSTMLVMERWSNAFAAQAYDESAIAGSHGAAQVEQVVTPLLREDILIGKAVARGRMQANEGRTSLKVSRGSELSIHEVGAIAEVVVSRVEGRPLNCAVQEGPDFTVTKQPDVDPWDVKGTTAPAGKLLIPASLAHRYSRTRKYLLVRLSRRKMYADIVGWAWGSDFIGKPERLDRRYREPAYTPKVLYAYPRPVVPPTGL